jgi:hypothetical protein
LDKPNHLHTDGAQNLRDMNCTGPIFKKTVLTACIGIVAMDETVGPFGSPSIFSTYSKTMDPNSTSQSATTIIMSTDPITCEMQAVKMLRLNKGKNYGVNDMPNYLKASAGISGALSGTVYNIGVIEEDTQNIKMERRYIINDKVLIGNPSNTPTANSPGSIHVSALPHHGYTFIQYNLPARFIGKQASISIHSMNGALVHKQSETIHGVANHYSWDHKDQAGKKIPAGQYIVRIVSGSARQSAHFFAGN